MNEGVPLRELATLGSAAQSAMGGDRQTRREVELAHCRALLVRLTEDARAALTHTALEHVGALTALESHLITVSPLGEARYRELVDSYTIAAGAAIRRFS